MGASIHTECRSAGLGITGEWWGTIMGGKEGISDHFFSFCSFFLSVIIYGLIRSTMHSKKKKATEIAIVL